MLKVTATEYPEGWVFNFEGANSVRMDIATGDFVQTTGKTPSDRQMESIIENFPEIVELY